MNKQEKQENHEVITMQKATNRNVSLRKIIEWMDEVYGKDDDQALLFYEDIKRRYPSFAEFMHKRLPLRVIQGGDNTTPITTIVTRHKKPWV